MRLVPSSFWLLPGRCVVCDKPSKTQRDLCDSCNAKLPHNLCCCQLCALPLATKAPLCGKCLKQPPPYTRTISAFSYEGEIPNLIHQFKYSGQRAYGRVLSESLLSSIKASYSGDDLPDLLLAVPLHWRRAIRRGFNQSHEISLTLSKPLGIPIAHNAIRRKTYQPPQRGLKRQERLKNLANAYAVTMPARIKGHHIAVIDDVMTTGATAITLTKLLRDAGAKRIDIWTLARTPNK